MKYTFMQLKKNSSVRANNEGCILGGCNFEGFPRHHFAHRKIPSAAPFFVKSAGEDEWKNGAFRYRRNSDTFSIELVLQGEFLIENGNFTYSVPAGSLFVVHLHRDSSMMCSTEYARKFTIILQGKLLEALLSALHLHDCTVLRLRNREQVASEMERIRDLLHHGEKEDLRHADAAAYSLLLLLSEECGGYLPDAMQKMLDFIQLHLDRMLSVSDLAQAHGLSNSAVHRLFLQYTQDTPLAYMTQSRMNAAEEMLRNGELSLKEISARLGYQNQLYFSTVFRKYHGLSPSAFRMGKKND